MVRCLFDIFVLNPVLLQRIKKKKKKKQAKTALMKYLPARSNEPNSSLPLDYLSLQQSLVNNKLNYQYKLYYTGTGDLQAAPINHHQQKTLPYTTVWSY